MVIKHTEKGVFYSTALLKRLSSLILEKVGSNARQLDCNGRCSILITKKKMFHLLLMLIPKLKLI
jgi:hypothetical protein